VPRHFEVLNGGHHSRLGGGGLRCGQAFIRRRQSADGHPAANGLEHRLARLQQRGLVAMELLRVAKFMEGVRDPINHVQHPEPQTEFRRLHLQTIDPNRQARRVDPKVLQQGLAYHHPEPQAVGIEIQSVPHTVAVGVVRCHSIGQTGRQSTSQAHTGSLRIRLVDGIPAEIRRIEATCVG
jgi:hypothetical protein